MSAGFKTPLAYCARTTTTPRSTGCRVRVRVCLCAFVGKVTGLSAASINCPFPPALKLSIDGTAAALFKSVSPVRS